MELILPLLLVLFAGFMFMNARRQRRQFQELQQMQSSLGTGDRVMTTSGLYATVVSTTDNTLDLELAPGVTTTWLRQAVREKVTTETVDDDLVDVDDTGVAGTDEVTVDDRKADGR